MNFSMRAVAASTVSLSLAFFMSGCACNNGSDGCVTGDEDVCNLDASVPPDPDCNTLEAARANPACALTVGDGCPAAKMGPAAVVAQGYITTLLDGGRDRDFYTAQLPGGLTPKCLLHVTAGYAVPQTAVNLSVNVLDEAGSTSIMSGLDKHGAAAPKFIDLITPFGESNAKIVLQLADEGATVQTKVDNSNPYSVKVEMLENPDLNEPNDTMPTPVVLAAATDGVCGKSYGYLATTNDVDTFSFDVTPAGRQIIYLHLSSPMANLLPPPPFRLSYGLLDPTGNQIAEGVMDNEFLQVNLSTARLAPSTGTFKLVVKGYKMDGQSAPVLGDLRLRYDVDLCVYPDKDMREPNDTVTAAQTVNIANGTQTLNGRISYVADEEWFKLVVGPNATARTLRYEITVAKTGGRFPPLSALPTRQLRLATQITTGMSPADRKTNCITNPALCPRSFSSVQSNNGQLVSTLCGIADPPQCLWGERNEEVQIMGLKDLQNFVGAVPVPTAGATYLMMFRDEGGRAEKYADDREWSMVVTLADDADEQSRVTGPVVVNLGATMTPAPGVISYGYGALLDFDPNQGRGVRGPNDYDAYETDKDLFQFNYPGAAIGDQSWDLQWTIANNTDGGRAPGDLALEITLCGSATPTVDGGLCGGERRFIFGANLGAVTPWYLPVTNGNQRVLFTKMVNLTNTVFTATAAGCNCLAASKVSAGKFFVNVAGVNRVTNDPIVYQLTQGVAPYPNGNAVCPVTDGGCRFAGQ